MEIINKERSGKYRISIIEDSEIHREWLKTELSFDDEIQITSTNRFGREGVDSVKLLNPNLVIVDFQLEDMTGLEVARRIKCSNNEIKIFMLTAHSETSIVERILNDKNVDAIAIKGSHYFEANFLFAIKRVIEGGNYLDPTLFIKLRNSKNHNALNMLTKREFEIFIQSNSGKSDDKIAKDLCIELSHVRNIKSRIAKKINNDVENLVLKLIENSKPILPIQIQ